MRDLPKVRGQPGHRVDLQTAHTSYSPARLYSHLKECLPKWHCSHMRPLLHLDWTGRNAGGRIIKLLGSQPATMLSCAYLHQRKQSQASFLRKNSQRKGAALLVPAWPRRQMPPCLGKELAGLLQETPLQKKTLAA